MPADGVEIEPTDGLEPEGDVPLPRLDTQWAAARALSRLGVATSAEVVALVDGALGPDGAGFRTTLGRQRLRERVASALSNLGRRGLAANEGPRTWTLTDAGRAWVSGEPIASASGPPLATHERRFRRAARLTQIWADAPAAVAVFDLARVSTADLVALFRQTTNELKRRDAVRTSGVIGEWGERLVCDAFGGRLAPPAMKGWDVEAPGWGRLQVKTRVVTDPAINGELQMGIVRSRDPLSEAFDYLAVVLLDDAGRVRTAVLLPSDVVAASLGPWRDRVGGREFFATDAVMFHPSTLDVTADVQAAERLYSHPPQEP